MDDGPRGFLRLGLGRGAEWVRADRGRAGAVRACVAADTRWDRQVDDRATYLARLWRDLRLDVGDLVALRDPDDELDLATEVLRELARGGDERAAAVVPDEPEAASPPPRRPPRALPDASEAELLALAASGECRRVAMALREITIRRRPVPELLHIVEPLAAARAPGLHGALRTLGPLVVPAARRWAGEPDHPLFRDAPYLLADHGDAHDIPVLTAALDRPDDGWCGFDVLTQALTRILPEAARSARVALARRLRWLITTSPHSYERASYLRSLLTLDPAATTAELPTHLLDCEAEVRLLATRHTPLTAEATRRLADLRDDPLEDDEVRQAVTDRLG